MASGFFFLLGATLLLVGSEKRGRRLRIGLLGILISSLAVSAVHSWQRAPARVAAVNSSVSAAPLMGGETATRNDAVPPGARIFAQHCASCHRYDGHDGLGGQPTDEISASDLKGFATREWLTGLLDPNRVDTHAYFGATAFNSGKMASYVKDDIGAFSAADKATLRNVILALSAEARLKAQAESDARDTALINEGRKALTGNRMGCKDCHKFHDVGEEDAPELTGYGSYDWLVAFISNPEHERFYGTNNDRMPAFKVEKLLTPEEIESVVRWLRGE